jgi:hypothetical protein
LLYFFINLAGHALITTTLVLLLIRRLRINQERRNRHGILYLLPVLLTGLILFQAISFTIPRLLDTTDIIRGIYASKTGTVEKIDFLNNAMTLDGERYFYNPMVHKPQVGDRLAIAYTDYSGYISDMDKV